MRVRKWLAVAAVASAAVVGLDARADLFERIRSKSNATAEGPSPLSFPVTDESEIGKILVPVSFQPALPAPADGALTPIPEVVGPVTGPVVGPAVAIPGFAPGMPVDGTFGGFPLFDRVKYDDLDNIHPCAVPTVVQVLDPCEPKQRFGLFGHRRHVDACQSCNVCEPCGPRVVFVKICVPPGCADVNIKRNGRKVTYQVGEYRVDVISKDGYVLVDYDD